ncbi:helix-turn-helix transcriptional regulator [Spirosoma montaniterrae]|uniref:Uncharacterized protein n=1 Tax=Spirosoma montaniterrae TaxID=1178516 RepID=A0A1P9WYG1_9BACT|nr:hypothetical protein [Spirosoma montaniterrae]AQG80383.1 hypothetical protein AWR27_14265 [Spirosoma montaniterrae]
MATSVSASTYHQIKQFVSEVIPPLDATELTVSTKQQDDELQRLIDGCREEQFFFIVNLQEVSLEHAHGWAEMGYPDIGLTFRDYLNMIPNKALSELMFILGKQAYRLSARLGIVRFMKPKYISQVPLRHKNGTVYLCKRTISAWQLSNKGLIIKYLSEFTLLKPYEGEALNPRFHGLDEAVKESFKRMVSQVFAQLPISKNPYSPREQQILKLYVDHPDTVLSASAIADIMQTKPATIQAYNKSIIEKTRRHFTDELPVQTARDVAFFLRRNGLLG